MQEEEVTLCLEPEPATLTPPTYQQGDASGGSSPGQPPAEPITERKASDVSMGLIQTLEEKEEEEMEEEKGPVASMATNWVSGRLRHSLSQTDQSERRPGMNITIQYISFNLFLFRYHEHETNY